MKRKINPSIEEKAYPKKTFQIARRDFLKYLGGGIVILFAPLEACRKIVATSLPLNTLPDDFVILFFINYTPICLYLN